MSSNWGPVREKYKKNISNMNGLSQNEKNTFMKRINNTFNTKVMEKVVEDAMRAMRTMYKKKVNEIQYLTRNERDNAKSRINVLVNEQPMKNVLKQLNARSKTNKQNAFKKINALNINNTRKNKFKNKINRMLTKPTNDELKKILKQAESFWNVDTTVLLSLIVLLISKGTLMYTGGSTPFVTKIGNYKNPSVYLNNKTYAAVKRYEQFYNKGELLENIAFYATVVFFAKLFDLFIKDKTRAKELLKSIMDKRLSRYLIGSISFEIFRRTAGQFVIAALTAYLHGEIYMSKERAGTPKLTNKFSTRVTTKGLKLAYIWFSPKFSKHLPSELNYELIKNIVDFFKKLESYGIRLSPFLLGRGLSGAVENVKNVASGITSSVKDRRLPGASAITWIISPGRGSVAQPPRTRDPLVLTNNRGTSYTFTNQNDIRNILNNQKYTNVGAQNGDIILKSNNGTRYRVREAQHKKATTFEPGYNSPRGN